MKNKEQKYCNTDAMCKTEETICLPESKFPRIVVVGGGFAGLALVDGLKKQAVTAV